METYKISHINSPRGANELIIYEGVASTGTNSYGVEAVAADGVIILFGANNNVVPENGFVISGHGASGVFMQENLKIGTKVRIDKERMLLYWENDSETEAVNREHQVDLLKKRFELCVANDPEYDLGSAMDAIQKVAEEGESAFEHAYYLTAMKKSGETRAIWHRPLETSVQEIENTVKRLADYSINMLLVEAFYDGYTIYPSELVTLRPDLQDKSFDMLEEFIKAGKKYGVEIHAWVENFFVGAEQFANENSCGSPIIDTHPHWAAVTKSGSIYVRTEPGFIYLNHTLDDVHKFLCDVYNEMLEKYDLDGIQLDYIRYPTTTCVNDSVGFDYSTIDAFFRETGLDVRTIPNVECKEWQRFNEWRCGRVTAFVERIYNLVEDFRAKGRDIALSTAIFGDPNEAIRLKSQDWRKWLENSWLSFISPMAYLLNAEDVYKEVFKMVQAYGDIPNVAGISPMYSRLPAIESTKQVEACRKAGAAGVAFFETKFFTDEMANKLMLGVFR